MTAITVLNKSNVPTGPFTRAQVAEKLQSGEFSLDDLAFVEGLSQWTPLREVLAKIDAPPAFAPPAAVPAYSYAATMQPPGHMAYAGFWLRLVAYLIDSLILGIPMFIFCVVLFALMGGFAVLVGLAHSSGNYAPNHQVNPAVPVGIFLAEFIIFLGLLIAGWLYYALLESGPGQSTYGKRVMGLKVTNLAGERISFGHASGRFFGKIVTGLVPFAIGYIMAGFTERKQALHDMIAGTLVVRN